MSTAADVDVDVAAGQPYVFNCWSVLVLVRLVRVSHAVTVDDYESL